MLKTKSVQLIRETSDGIRICTMRRIKPEFDFDMWLPVLSPSTELLKDHHDGKVTWEEFSKKLRKELFPKQNIYLEMIYGLSKTKSVTLLCWEETHEECHRSLLAQELQKLHPQLKIQLS